VTGRVVPAVKLTVSYANRPVRLVDEATGRTVSGGEVVRDQLYLDLDASLALFDRVKLGVGLPFAAAQSGDATYRGSRSLQGAGLADMRVGARVALLGARAPPWRWECRPTCGCPPVEERVLGRRSRPRPPAAGHQRPVGRRVLYAAALA
jgi:hypothetical protein